MPSPDAEPAPPSTARAAPPAAPLAARPLSPRTLQFYARDWAAFVAWCRGANARPLPAEAATLAAYLTAASIRLSPGTLARHLAAIADQHRRHGQHAPTNDPAVKAALKMVRRAAAPHRDPPPSQAALTRMIAACPGDLAGLRDRALLALMAATGLGRAALVSLDAEAVRISAAGCELRVGAEGASERISLPRTADLARCPVQALEIWLRVSDTSFGAVFRKVDRWGNVAYQRLGTDALRRILARRTPARPRAPRHNLVSTNRSEPA